MGVNIEKVAKMARISTATVSRVINNPEKVSKRTRDTVERIIKELKYVPNQQARSLRSQKTGMIAIIVPHSADYLFAYPYFSILLKELSLELKRYAYHLILTTDEPTDPVTGTYRLFVEKKMVDGFVVLDLRNNDDRVRYLREAGVSFVTVGRDYYDDASSSYVDTDNDMGAFLAGRHLAELGCRRILFISGAADQSVSDWRKQGLKRASQEFGFDYEIFYGDFLEKSGAAITKKSIKEFDGIFAASDLMAMGALAALKESGARMPVVGFDDIPLSAEHSPSLTTIHQPIAEVGEAVARSIFKQIVQGETSKTILPVEIVIRESTEVIR